MRARAAGLPIRLASKSIRVRGLIEQVLREPGYQGVLAYSAAEAGWLAQHGADDVLVAYPTVDAAVVAEVAADAELRERVTFMADLPDHLRILQRAAGEHVVRVCLDVDSSLDLGPAHLGVHRSSVHTPREAAEFARVAQGFAGVRLVGLMFYDAQIAGMQDTGPAIRLVKRKSAEDLRVRRREVRAAVEQYAELELVNAGGTGSLHADWDYSVTELAAGSGLFTPTLFDGYDGTDLRPAAYFASPVVRKPRSDIAVTFSGGYSASGVAGPSRTPRPVHPEGLHLLRTEGAGEVQTPLRGGAARQLAVGDLVWFRHAKAGEMCERFNEILLVRDGAITDRLATYRGEGQNFG
ncbi:amino acid deaminase/aldolase [Flexivirga caeni]|uniref:Amino acid deaminase/aldolase n=2 Tax=Flexivirga caeni TaxID=2294115 RepID=A0A3M9MJ25_9MICO|nr:amino acid deaminase/aldolase [Flexivirga caeni]